MTQQVKQNIFDETQKYLLPLFNNSLRKIILYGSYARNDESDESDIDIMILTDLEEHDIKTLRDQIIDITVELSLKYNVLFSFITLNINHFNEYLDILPFYQIVLKEGAVLYER